MAVVQTIVVDMSTRGANPVAYTHQNDEWRTFHFEMYNNGEAVDMTGWSCKVGAILPSNDGGYRVIAGDDMDSASINGNYASATLGSPYTDKAGNGVLTLIFTTDTGHTIRPINIDFRIQESADGEDVVAGASDFVPVLEQYMAENMETYIDAWLDEHPEATTTVQDGSITYSKLNQDVADIIAEDGISFECGETDDDIYTVITIPEDRYKMTLEALRDDPSESSTIDDYVRREKPFLAINISNTDKFVFNGTQYGANYAPGTHGSTYALKSNSVDFTVLDSSLYQADIIAAGYLSACAGWNCLRLNGENLEVDYTYPTYANPNPRQTLAWDDNNWYIYTSYSRLTFCGDSSTVNKFGITMQEARDFCVAKGWPNVAALDGGGSIYIASGKPYRRLAKNMNNGYWRDAHVCIAWNERTAET